MPGVLGVCGGRVCMFGSGCVIGGGGGGAGGGE